MMPYLKVTMKMVTTTVKVLIHLVHLLLNSVLVVEAQMQPVLKVLNHRVPGMISVAEALPAQQS